MIGFSPEMSVITYTIREGGLSWMAKYLAGQTFKNFEWIVIDGFYNARHDELTKQCKDLGVHLIHLPEPKLPYKLTDYNIASNGNEALKHVTTPWIVIIDDWHIFPDNLLETHIPFLKKGFSSIPTWHHIKRIVPTGDEYSSYPVFEKSVLTPLIYDRDSRFTAFVENYPRYMQLGHQCMIEASESWWWPNSTSVPTKFIIDECGGYDERLNGGTGGTDIELAIRMKRAGLRFIYIPETIVYHVDTSGLIVRTMDTVCPVGHDRTPFTNNQYHQGDPNLIETDTLKTVRDPDGIKYYTCKYCGGVGLVDSQEAINATYRSNHLVPPTTGGGIPRRSLLEERKKLFSNGYNHSTLCETCKV